MRSRRGPGAQSTGADERRSRGDDARRRARRSGGGGRCRGHACGYPSRRCGCSAGRRQACAGREATRVVLRRGLESRRGSRKARAHPDVRPHLLIYACRQQDPRGGPLRTARRRAICGLGPRQPRPRPARHRRAVGSRPARPVDSRLHPARRVPPAGGGRAWGRPDRCRPGLHRLSDPPADRRCDRARSRQLAVANQDPYDDDWRLEAHTCVGRPPSDPADLDLRSWRRPAQRRGAPRGRAARRHDLLPSRRHGRARPARAGRPRGGRRGVCLGDQGGSQTAHRRHVRPARPRRARGRVGEPGIQRSSSAIAECQMTNRPTADQPLRGQRILVTGGAGTIGSTIVDELVRAGAADIVVLDNFVRGRRENLAAAQETGKITVVEGDIRDRALLESVTAGIDVVFHQAAIRITQCAEEPRLALEVLADGTFNVLEAAVSAKVRKVVAASSASIYGQASAFPTAESHHPYANDTIYGAAKVFNEGLLRSFHAMSGLDYVALRYFNVIGPRMDVHGLYTEVLVRWIERIMAGQPLLILGDGQQTMDFIDVRDVARANILAAQSPATDVALNVASGVETSLRELAAALLRVTRSDSGIEYGPARTVNAVQRRLADTSAAAELIGFTARIGLEESLRDLVAWFQAERLAAQ